MTGEATLRTYLFADSEMHIVGQVMFDHRGQAEDYARAFGLKIADWWFSNDPPPFMLEASWEAWQIRQGYRRKGEMMAKQDRDELCAGCSHLAQAHETEGGQCGAGTAQHRDCECEAFQPSGRIEEMPEEPAGEAPAWYVDATPSLVANGSVIGWKPYTEEPSRYVADALLLDATAAELREAIRRAAPFLRGALLSEDSAARLVRGYYVAANNTASNPSDRCVLALQQRRLELAKQYRKDVEAVIAKLEARLSRRDSGDV